MEHLHSPAGRAALLAAMARRPLLAFDFDGTLAPIVERPEDARVPPPIALRLGQLAQVLPVAIVSGRRVDDVRARLGFEPFFIIGNHGAEDPVSPAPWARAFDGLRIRLQAHAAALADAGVVVEDKLQSIALHYRGAANPALAVRLTQSVLSDLPAGLQTLGGKMVCNVVAADAPDKADAVATLQRRSGAAATVFAGDDINDEPVFARADASWLTVKVGLSPQPTQARYYVEDVGGVEGMLATMVKFLGLSDT